MSKKTLRILHTNDLHSQFENWPSVTALLKEKKEEAVNAGEEVLLFDIGDHADRVHPMTEGLHGKGNVSLLNDLNYDAVTIGNNEGMTFAKQELDELYVTANFPVILSNLYDENGKRPKWCKPYDIITTPSGLKVGIAGVTVPFYLFYETLGWKIIDPFESIAETVTELKGKTDLLICLSHLGLFDDEKMAEQFPEFDLILGAHTHHVLESGQNQKGTWINQSGRSGKFIGDVRLSYERSENGIECISTSISSVPVDHEVKDLQTVERLEQLTNLAKEKLSREVTTLSKPLEISWFEESEFAKLLAETLKEWCDADVGMVNAGVLLDRLSEGPVTYEDLHKICPHPINPATVMISGEKLLELIRQANKKEMVEYKLRGFGFRGKILGTLVFDDIIIDTNASYIQERDVYVQGKPLDRHKEYKLATVDMFTFGHLYPIISSIEEKRYFMPELLRDILAWKLKRMDH
ncbi:bifunctional metallophosphatase/5'-nucleotidase [Bacillus shivajii]|uniref:bifunctional metallophosphatase/5'-nucleotidase n=1 Tax=Bacillus shivajii TaxID=1983719 RepID=UPI001CFAC8C9|nr:bifunctional UDP-sugar hydrolase/5'-nucleotidase [Bacillus shivajii]UCZ52560.1 bifunctional metallophosphatase/5'-nucleotidase [Bacillus shivajii]